VNGRSQLSKKKRACWLYQPRRAGRFWQKGVRLLHCAGKGVMLLAWGERAPGARFSGLVAA